MKHSDLLATLDAQPGVELVIAGLDVALLDAESRYSSDNHGDHHHYDDAAQTRVCVYVDRHTAISTKQRGDVLHSHGVDRKVVARNRTDAPNMPADGRVHAMVVARRKVHDEARAAPKLLGLLLATDKLADRIRSALYEKSPSRVDGGGRNELPVRWAYERARIGLDRPNASS
jgi:hypothetical protein